MPSKSELVIFGVRINSLSWQKLDDYCLKALLEDIPKHIITVNGEILLRANTDKSYAKILNDADLVIADSTNIAVVAALKGKPIEAITAGADLVDHLAKIAVGADKTVFLLGGREGVAVKAAAKLRQNNSNLKIAGSSSADPDDVDILKNIKESGADILLVAYGSPQQEKWIAKHKRESGAKILVGIGGAFDMLADILPRAPLWLRKIHLEWLWRFILQPSRIRRIWRALVIFPLKAIFSISENYIE